MKSDMDALMEKRDLEAILVVGHEGYNPERYYMTNGARITGGVVAKKRGVAPIIVANPMETQEAAESGHQVYSWYDMGWAELLEEAEGDRSKVYAGLWVNTLKALDTPGGKVGIYGTGQINLFVELVERINSHQAEYQFVGEMGVTLFDEAFLTKDAAELAILQSVAKRGSEVMGLAWDFISTHRAQGDAVVKADGTPLTIGDVKLFVRRELMERGLQDTGMIFSQGVDSGHPHSRGKDEDVLKVGQSIVFDCFPMEFGGGYYFDTTRTWCIGHAPDEVKQAYDDVMDAFDVAIETFRVGQPAHQLQERVQDFLESKGHPTTRSDPKTSAG
ncbi:MAG: M24 family metallopeptidase, partial [Chloroflexi bacterium]